MENVDIAKIFDEVAGLLQIQGANRFASARTARRRGRWKRSGSRRRSSPRPAMASTSCRASGIRTRVAADERRWTIRWN